MLMRVFQVAVHDRKEAECRDLFEHTALPLMQRQDGLLSITAGAPRPETPQEFCMVMVWRDAHVHADEALLVEARRVSHSEVVADDVIAG